MQRPSKKWLKSIAVKICILLLVAYPSIVLAQNDVEKSRSEAQNAAGSVYEYLGTGEAINQNAAQPLTSSKTPMKTIDQSQSFLHNYPARHHQNSWIFWCSRGVQEI